MNKVTKRECETISCLDQHFKVVKCCVDMESLRTGSDIQMISRIVSGESNFIGGVLLK